MFRTLPRSVVDDAGLTDEQQYFVKTVVLRRANVLLCAAAGTGKSTCIGVLRRYAELNGVRAAWTASTGVASCALGGTSVYSWAGLRRPCNTPEDKQAYLSRVTHSGSAAGHRLRGTHLLVVDEVSMLPPFVLTWIDAAARAVREEPHAPFGGMQVVLVGDFLQLQPVRPRTQDAATPPPPPLFASAVLATSRLVPCVLTRLMRQDADDDLTRILGYVRRGAALPDALRDALLSRVTPQQDVPAQAMWIVSTRAAAHRVCRDKAWVHRAACTDADGKQPPLTLLRPAVFTVEHAHARGTKRHRGGAASAAPADPASVTTRVDKDGSVTLALPGHCVHSFTDQPMSPTAARRTLSDAPSQWPLGVSASQFARGVCDGMAGHVFPGMRVVVLANVHKGGRIVAANGQCGVWVGHARGCARVRMDASGAVVDVPPTVHTWRRSPEAGPATRALQAAWWPVAPAYGLTVHRVQGSTMAQIAVELSSDVFAPQQAYVALSRARRLRDVYILPNVDLSCLQHCDVDAVRWYDLLHRTLQERQDTLPARRAPQEQPVRV